MIETDAPATEAGMALLNDFMGGDGVLNRQPPRGSVAQQILAIESQARLDTVTRIRERLLSVTDIDTWDQIDMILEEVAA